ncbi:MAG: RsbRD N-terminal domain-containing protein [Desulfovibrio sp.]|jgi:hypothetical protein|nr:RsbRD N-terminal domain-containing protein [Desulfovibrio sp.]
MRLTECLRDEKEEILRLWMEAVYATYPFDAKGVLRTVSDPFGNPGADMTREAAHALYDAVMGEETTVDGVKGALERFVKLRAVQRDTPSRALGVFHLLKPIMRQRLLPHCTDSGELNGYLAAESRLDSLILLAFDMYMADRETLAESRVKEIRSQHAQLTKWAQAFKKSLLVAG